jgi:2-phosphosulfolactate phosphatase
MRIDVALHPSAFNAGDGTEKIVVVVDVLRASATIIAALANGAKAIIPLATPEEVRNHASKHCREEVLLCGERQGVCLPGFDLGNSPREYKSQVVAGKVLYFTSTNGTQILAKARDAQRVFVSGFNNVSASLTLLKSLRADTLIVCAGCEGLFSLEDAVYAGMLVRGLEDLPQSKKTDSAEAACLLYDAYAHDLQGMASSAFWGKQLIEIGLGDDIPVCVAVDSQGVVPELLHGRLVKSRDREDR